MEKMKVAARTAGVLFAIFICASCTTKERRTPLVTPPSFCEIPDLKHPEQIPTKTPNDVEVQKLKDLLLKSEE